MSKTKKGIALAISGGGYRSTLFALGSLWRINEFGLLQDIKRITSVSGGSILSGYLAMKWKDLIFDPETKVATNFERIIADPIRKFCSKSLDFPAVFLGLLSPQKSMGDKVADFYSKRLFGSATLRDIPAVRKAPEFIFYAASLQTGDGVRISRHSIYDYKIGELPNPRMYLAKVVAASSAFPPVFSPVKIECDPDSWEETKYATLFHNKDFKNKLILTDGGAYDNMGLEAAWNEGFESVFVCNAGAPWKNLPRPQTNMLLQIFRVYDVMGAQGSRQRKQILIENYKAKDPQGKPCPRYTGAYWGIDTEINNYELKDAMVKDSATTSNIKYVRTRLNRFKPDEQGKLINWGYTLTDTALRKHYLKTKPGKGQWPIPEYALDLYYPGYVKDFFKAIYPRMQWGRIEFHKGLPKGLGRLITNKKAMAITLCSWKSKAIDIYFREDQWEPWRTCDGMELIGHELYHAKDILSLLQGKGWGLFRLWYVAYVICLIFTLGNSGKKHYLEAPAYEIEDGIRQYFMDKGVIQEKEVNFAGIPLDSNFLSQYVSDDTRRMVISSSRNFLCIIWSGLKKAFKKG